jgi:imidazole glycerol-phosphate synthase subunit HisH
VIAIVDYGMGNLLSVYHAFESLGVDVQIINNPDALEEAERIVLPGVGAFADCMRSLREKGFHDALNDSVIVKRVPILGICLGMQVMARRSFEGGQHDGLGWIEAEVVRLNPDDTSLRVPQIGWNDVTYRQESPLFAGQPNNPDFYFVHSYHMVCDRRQDVEATCDYGEIVTAAVKKDNIFATQFHPEKSQDHGLKILENFTKWHPELC